jgi:hypothetical protein
MKYHFHRCQTHSKLPDLQGWYLELRPDDPETVMKVHRGVAAIYYAKFGQDPHIQADETRKTLYNPVKLAASWLLSVERYLMAGEIVLVNVNGGLMPLHGTVILETVASDDIDWDVRFDDEIVTISRWPEGKHYYLCSNKSRIFVPDKHSTYEAARKAASRYAPAERIKSRQ